MSLFETAILDIFPVFPKGPFILSLSADPGWRGGLIQKNPFEVNFQKYTSVFQVKVFTKSLISKTRVYEF